MSTTPGERASAPPRVVIVGAGALGSVYGAVLDRAGCAVQLFAREAHARAIQEQGGLHVHSFEGDWFAPVTADWRGEQIEPVDIAILMTKTPDSGAALAALQHLRATVDTAVSWQNGLAKDSVLAQWCGLERVLGGASMVGAVTVAPGVVRHTFTGPTFIGEFSSGPSSRSTRLRSLLERGGLPVVEADDIASVEWSKVIQVLPAMALTALTRLRYHEVLTSDELARVFARLVREAAAVAIADGATVADWPGMLPIKTLAELPEEEAVTRIQSFGKVLVDNGQTHIKPSMLQSIERGRRLEVEEIHGHVVEAARRLEVPAPTVTVCYELLRGIDRSLAPGK